MTQGEVFIGPAMTAQYDYWKRGKPVNWFYIQCLYAEPLGSDVVVALPTWEDNLIWPEF